MPSSCVSYLFTYHPFLQSLHHHLPINMSNPCNQTSGCPASHAAVSVGFFEFPKRSLILSEIRAAEVLVALVFFLVIHALRQRKRYGLAVWPVFGMLPSLIGCILRGETYEWLCGLLHHGNGTFIFKGPWFSNLNCVVTSDPRNLEYLLKTKFTNFPKGDYFRNTVRDLLGDGIFSADDEIWRRQRKTASIEFHSSDFRNMTTESLNELVHSRLLPVLEDSIKQNSAGNYINLQDVLLRLTFDNVCMIAFGADPGCLSQGLPKIPFAKAFEDATEVTVLRFVTPTFLWKIMRYFNIGLEKELKRCIRQVDDFANGVINSRKKELALDLQNEKKSRSDLLTVFMRLKDEQGEAFSDKFLRDICVNFILAGRDTSSVALSWFFWLVNNNPEVEGRILEEIQQIIGDRNNEEQVNEGVSGLIFKPQEVKKMEYLHASLSEALRLYPSVPLDHKEVIEDDELPDGTILKKGAKVIYAIYAMGRMESIWGKDCREFKPERWLREGRFTSESAYKFSAFNGGPRLCLGKDFAYYQMKFVAASILYRYRVKVLEDHPVVPKLALTMYMKHGLKVKLERRDPNELKDYLKIQT